jgi:peptidoglycan hydrolase CwlO-like protein
MKYLIAIGVVVGIGVVVTSYVARPEEVVYTTEPQVIEKTVEVNPLDEQIKQRENELDEKYQKIKSLEARLDVLRAERERLDAEIKALQSDLSSFMTATTLRR